MPEKIIAVVGPTASGKTALAVELARRLGGEIVSCDSMQIYRRMQIGVAAPTDQEMGGIPHHLIGIVEPDAEFSCVEFTERAQICIRDIAARGKMPILCGGTGLYLDSLLHVASFSESEKNEGIRQALLEYAQEHGADALYHRLEEADPESAAQIHPNNVRRVIRALEILQITGIPKSEWDRRSRAAAPRYNAQIFVLNFHDRDRLYARIDARVDAMFAQGLEREARALFDDGLLEARYVAAQAIGFKEFLPYFSHQIPLEAVAAEIKLASRRYAKRQLTWFRRYTDAVWLYPDDGDSAHPVRNTEELAEEALAVLQEKHFAG